MRVLIRAARASCLIVAVTCASGEMVERGYVERRPDPNDSRVKRLRLSVRGKAALRAARRFHAAFEAELGRELGAATVRRFRQVLERITHRSGDREIADARLRPM